MNERICWVFMFSSCTTAPVTGVSAASMTTPRTLRVVGSPFFWANTAVAGRSRRRTVRAIPALRFMRPSFQYDVQAGSLVASTALSPVLVGLLFLVFHEAFFVFLFVVGFVGGF